MDEPRVRDLDLADRLGFDRPRDIRKLVERNMLEIRDFGVCATVAQTSGARGGRPSTEYWLNEEQALLVSSLSDPPPAPKPLSKSIIGAILWYAAQGRRAAEIAKELGLDLPRVKAVVSAA